MKIRLSDLEAVAPRKPPGYLADVLSHGQLADGVLTLSAASYAALCLKYRQYGDAVAMVAQPVARAVDAALGTKVAECGGCKGRQRKWNGDGEGN